jgi:threonine/homoserine/homoserine lactone efflux protein
MTFIIFVQIFIVCLLGAMSPGPSMAVVINNAIFKGRYVGILTSIGHGVGITFYATFAVLGLGLIIKTNLFIFNGLKILSIIFLIFIGMKSILNKEKLNLKKNDMKENTVSFLQGFSISILNPKILVWFIAIYSQFMSADNKLIFNIYLVSIAGIVDACWYILLTLVITTASTLNFFQTKIKLIKKIQGFFFIILGFILLVNLFYEYMLK